MNVHRHLAILFFATMLSTFSFAQMDGFDSPSYRIAALKVKGVILKLEDGKKIKGAQVTVENKLNGKSFTQVAKSGKYKLSIQYDQLYELNYAADGYHTKKIEVDTRNIPYDKQSKLKMDIEVDLFKRIKGFDEKVLFAPISKALFKPNTNNLGWDTDYYRKRLAEIDAERARALDAQSR